MGHNNVLHDYNMMNNRLKKKRIIRMPNIAEAMESFENLATRSERCNDLHTAALCYRSASKRAASLGQNKHSAVLLVRAARLFIHCESTLSAERLISTSDNLQAALHCYNEARERWAEKNSTMAGALSLEMGIKLADLGKRDAALIELQKAALWFRRSPLERIHCLQKILDIQIKNDAFHEALKTCSDALEETNVLPITCHRDTILKELEVTRILLLLIVEPVPSELSIKEVEVLEKMTWVESTCDAVDTAGESEGSHVSLSSHPGLLNLNKDLFLLLQSTVMAAQSCDAYNLAYLETGMSSYLSSQQAGLMRQLVRTISKEVK